MPPQYQTYEPSPELGRYYREVLQRSSDPVDFKAVYNEGLREKQAIEAQQLNQQSVQMSLAEKQRQAAMDRAQSEAIAAEYAANPEAYTPEMATKAMQKIAMQHGDADRILAVEKATRERAYGAGSSPIGEALGAEMGLDPQTPANVARLMLLERQRQDTERMRNDPTRVRNRELDATLKEQRSTGTQIRPATPAMAAKVGAARSFVAQMDDIESYYTPYVSESRGERFLAMLANPNSAAFRLNKELTLAAKNAALALEDRVTDQDYKTIADIVTINKLDTMDTVLDKMFRLKEFIARRTNADLDAAEAAGFNVSGLKGLSASPEALVGQPNPQPTPTGPPTPNSGRTPEQEARYQKVKAARAAQLEAGGQ